MHAPKLDATCERLKMSRNANTDIRYLFPRSTVIAKSQANFRQTVLIIACGACSSQILQDICQILHEKILCHSVFRFYTI